MLFYERCFEKRVTANDVCFEGNGTSVAAGFSGRAEIKIEKN